MYINNNLSALDAWRNLVTTQSALNTSIMRLSSGLRINSSADDPAGYAISQQMQSQIMGYNQANRNAQDGISMIQTANGALNQTLAILQNMRQLALESASSTQTTSDRQDIQSQIDQFATELTQIANTTQYNTKDILLGAYAPGQSAITLQVGANANQTISFNLAAVDAQSLGVAGNVVTGLTAASLPSGVGSVTLAGSNGVDSYDLASGSSSSLTGYNIVFSAATSSSGTVVTAQLETSSGSLIGSAVALTSNTSYEIGNPSANMAVALNVSSVSNLESAATVLGQFATTAVTVNSNVSSAAQVSNSNVSIVTYMSAALTYAATSVSIGTPTVTSSFTGATITSVTGEGLVNPGSTASPYEVEFVSNGTAATAYLATTSGSTIGAGVAVVSGTTNYVIGNAATDQEITITGVSSVAITTAGSGTFVTGITVNAYDSSPSNAFTGVTLSYATAQGLFSANTTQSAYQIVVNRGTGTSPTETLQLETTAGSAIGSAVTISSSATNYVIGDAATNQEITVTNVSYAAISAAAAGAYTTTVTLSETPTATLATGSPQAYAAGGISVINANDAQNAVAALDAAIQTITAEQGTIGAVQDRLQYTIASLGAASDNITAAQSRITGVDMARETAIFTQQQILLQSGTSMLFNANQIPQVILKLLQ